MTETSAFAAPGAAAIPLVLLKKDDLPRWLEDAAAASRAWVEANAFTAERGKHLVVPGDGGRIAAVLVGVAGDEKVFPVAGLPESLPSGNYRIESRLEAKAAGHAALGWALGTYAFTRYRKNSREWPRLVVPEGADRAEAERLARAVFLVRDLVNTGAEDMGPAELASAAEEVARRNHAEFRVAVGDELLTQNFPAIHAVGRASARPPRLVDFTWGSADAPKVTLVGKGVCFDSGGLDIKPSSNMRHMKKDMGGAATVLGLAGAIMEAGLKVRLRVLIPAVENAISANAFRPGDVLRTRKGITVEIGNTDAEGRLILCDALTEAEAEKPALLVDCATLTGAARVALGPDLPALFCNDDKLAEELLGTGAEEDDPLWRLPLWKPYRKMLDSKVADINNVSEGGFAGALTAALYLEEFVSKETPWAHIDLFAWNQTVRPGRPQGGEAYALRALYALIKRRFG